MKHGTESLLRSSDNFIRDETQHTFTKAGNLRGPTKTQLCDMMVRAWDSISRDMIVKSFRVCGQVRDVNVDEITAFQEGRCASDGTEFD